MRIIKFLTYSLCLTMFLSLVTASAVFAKEMSNSGAKNELLVLKGTSYTHLDDTGVKTDKTVELSADLSLTKLEIKDTSVHIEGALNYGGQEYKIARTGTVQVNTGDNTKTYFEFYEYLSSDPEIIIANAIIDSINNTISFVIFNKNNNDLIKLEGDFSSNTINLNTLDRSFLSEVTSTYELYESRIFIPVDFGVEESEKTNFDNILLSNTGGKSLSAWIEYSNGTRHYLDYSLGLSAPTKISGDGNVQSNIRIDDKYVLDANGTKIRAGNSDLNLGSQYSGRTPIKASFTLTNGSNTVRDYVTHMRWYSQNDSTMNMQNELLNTRLIQTLIRLTTNLTKTASVSEGTNFTQIYFPQDNGYPYNTESPYPNQSYLHKVGSHFTEVYKVNSIGIGNGAKKGARIRYTVPVHTIAGTLVTTQDNHVQVQYSP